MESGCIANGGYLFKSCLLGEASMVIVVEHALGDVEFVKDETGGLE